MTLTSKLNKLINQLREEAMERLDVEIRQLAEEHPEENVDSDQLVEAGTSLFFKQERGIYTSNFYLDFVKEKSKEINPAGKWRKKLWICNYYHTHHRMVHRRQTLRSCRSRQTFQLSSG